MRIKDTDNRPYQESHQVVQKWTHYALAILEQADVDIDTLEIPRFWVGGEPVPDAIAWREYRPGADAGEAAPDPRIKRRRAVERDRLGGVLEQTRFQ